MNPKYNPRGLRNHNPGNIKRSGIAWQGLAAAGEMNAEQQAERTFEVFRGPWWGIRAMARILLTYQRKYHLKTVREIITRWAPGEDNNDPDGYAAYVADYMNVHPDDEVDVTDYRIMRRIIPPMVQMENGAQPYTWELETGLILAGIEPREMDGA